MTETGYGSATFARACDVSKACREVAGSGPRASWRRFQAGSFALTRYRRSLPEVTVRLTGSPAGRMIGEHFAIREEGRFRYRDAQGVLRLPATYSGYVRGRHRQAVRTNATRALEAGLTVTSTRVDPWTPGTGDFRADHIGPGPVERWMVLDANGGVVADSIFNVDAEVALLQGLSSIATYARWLLHSAIVESLCGSCEVLLINSDDAYQMTPGEQYFQRLLGYEIARLRFPPATYADRHGRVALSAVSRSPA